MWFLDKFKKRDLKEVRQENSLATFAPKINPSDQQIDWNKVSDEIDRKIRSLYPKYVAYTFLGSWILSTPTVGWWTFIVIFIPRQFLKIISVFFINSIWNYLNTGKKKWTKKILLARIFQEEN